MKQTLRLIFDTLLAIGAGGVSITGIILTVRLLIKEFSWGRTAHQALKKRTDDLEFKAIRLAEEKSSQDIIIKRLIAEQDQQYEDMELLDRKLQEINKIVQTQY